MTATSVNLDNTIGCLFVGSILWAASTVQLCVYFDRCSKVDTWRLKTYVAFVWLVDASLQVVTLRASYNYFVRMFGNFIALTHFDKSTFPLFTIMSASVNVLVQALVLMRIWHMSKRSKLLTGVTAVLILSQFAVTCAYFAAILPLSDFFQLESAIKIERATDVTIATVDTAIGTILAFLLNKSRTGFSSSDSIINRLILYTVASGLLTAADAIITLTVSLVLPRTLLYFLFASIGPKLYVNSMLTLLNSRQRACQDASHNQSSHSFTDMRSNWIYSMKVVISL
ncbi:hypothetical protein ACEPAF_85 [Sanghuangporus sanghuang]